MVIDDANDDLGLVAAAVGGCVHNIFQHNQIPNDSFVDETLVQFHQRDNYHKLATTLISSHYHCFGCFLTTNEVHHHNNNPDDEDKPLRVPKN